MAGAQTGRTERLPTIVNPLQCPSLEDRARVQGGTEEGRPGSKSLKQMVKGGRTYKDRAVGDRVRAGRTCPAFLWTFLQGSDRQGLDRMQGSWKRTQTTLQQFPALASKIISQSKGSRSLEGELGGRGRMGPGALH